MSGDPDGESDLKTDFQVHIDQPWAPAFEDGRYMARNFRQLDEQTVRALLQESDGSSLRKLAAKHRLSHETVRRALSMRRGLL